MKQPFAVFSPEHVSRVVQSLVGIELQTDATFSPEVNARLRVVDTMARSNVQRLDLAALESAIRLAAAAATVTTGAKKVMWLHRAGQEFNKAYSSAAACRSGCHHCCHIPVSITRTEANFIAKATGHRLAKMADGVPVQEAGYNNPCPFLHAQRCSIWEHRPMTCRVHLNMDSDDLLCRLVAGVVIPVPYANKNRMVWAEAAALGGDRLDIRQWFQHGSS